MTTTKNPLEHFDLHDPELAPRYYEVTGAARRSCPIGRTDASGGYWVVTRYDDVKTVLQNPSAFCSERGVGLLDPKLVGRVGSILETDPPRHRELRRPVEQHLTKRQVWAAHEPAVRALAHGLVDSWIDRGEFEVVSEYSGPLSAGSLASLMGLDFDQRRSDLLEAAQYSAQGTRNGSPEDPRLHAFVERVIRDRQASGAARDDVLSTILDGGDFGDRPLSDDELYGNVRVLITAGFGTTKAAIANIALRLTQTPGLEDRLRDPRWVESDLDELLRLDSPVTGLCRVATQDVELGGQVIREGDRVMVLYASANRDEDFFTDSDRLDFDRPVNPHLAFGMGIHRCIGSNLARMGIAVGYDVLLSRVKNLALKEGTEIVYAHGNVRAPLALPVTFDVI